ncbi:MAG: hypothetical protein ACI39W_06340 [Brotaphodocola sp.]
MEVMKLAHIAVLSTAMVANPFVGTVCIGMGMEQGAWRYDNGDGTYESNSW